MARCAAACFVSVRVPFGVNVASSFGVSGVFDICATLLDDILILIDGDDIVRRINVRAESVLGVRVLDAPLVSFLRQPQLMQVLADSRAHGVAGELLYRRIGGRGGIARTPREYRVKILPFFEGYFLIVLIDLSARQNVEKIQADFVANVSHELRSPLTALMGFIETLQDMPPPGSQDDLQHMLSIMAAEAERMKRLIDGLLMLSRLQAEIDVPLPQKIDLDNLFKNIVKTLMAQAQKIGMPLDYQCDFTAPPHVAGASDDLRMVFHNLIDNALKYGEGQNPIHIHLRACKAREGDIIVDIINRGAPIAAHHLPRLTERFYRIDTARTGQNDSTSGTGLGLAIVKHIVHRHNGRLSIKSNPDGINIFSIHLPKYK